MVTSEVGLDFPDVGGCWMQPHIISETPASIILWFYKASDKRTMLTDIRIFLVNAHLGEAHIDFCIDDFPPLNSYAIHDIQNRKKLTIQLEGGSSLSFLYEKAFYFSSTRPIPPVAEKR